jgi:hypothetical protein
LLKKKNCFKLDIPGNSWIFDTLGEKQYKDWVSGLKDAMGDNPWSLIIDEKEKEKAKKRSITLTVRSDKNLS